MYTWIDFILPSDLLRLKYHVGVFWVPFYCFRNNIEGKITEYWLVNEDSIFFLISFVKRAKLLAQNGSSGCLATANAISGSCCKKVFCNNGVPFWDSWRRIYRRIKRQELKWKHKEKHGVSEECFKKWTITGQIKRSAKTMSSIKH